MRTMAELSPSAFGGHEHKRVAMVRTRVVVVVGRVEKQQGERGGLGPKKNGCAHTFVLAVSMRCVGGKSDKPFGLM